MHALGGEELARGLQVLGGDAQARALLHGARVVESLAHRDHHAAAGDAEVERLVQALPAMLGEHILAGDAEVGGAVCDVGRGVGSAHDDEIHVAARSGNDELAGALRVFPRNEADAREQRPRLLEDPSLGQRDADAGHEANEKRPRRAPPA